MNKNKLAENALYLLAPLIAVILALLVGAVLLLLLNINPIEAYTVLLQKGLGDSNSLLLSLTRATPLLIVAIGISIAFRGGVINIGAEGQLFIGAVTASAFAIAGGEALPGWILLPGTIIVGMFAGGFWGMVPGVLKARFGVNEILSTIMMNQIAIQLLFFLLSGPMIDPKEIEAGTRIAQSARLPESVWLPRFSTWTGQWAEQLQTSETVWKQDLATWLQESFPRSTQLHAGLLIAIALAVLVYIFLWRTTIGYRIRAVGISPDASKYAGIPVQRYTVLSLALSGALAGIAGAVEVMGVPHRMVEGFAVGYGFTGIVVALFGRLHPLGAIPSAFLFGVLLVGADKMQRVQLSDGRQVPSEVRIILQGLVVLFVVSSEYFVRRRAKRVTGAEPPAPQLPNASTPQSEVAA